MTFAPHAGLVPGVAVAALGKSALQFWCPVKVVGHTHRVDTGHGVQWPSSWWQAEQERVPECQYPSSGIVMCGPFHTGFFSLHCEIERKKQKNSSSHTKMVS